MTCQNYIPVLTEIGFPKDIGNIINEYANTEYLNYCILSNKIIEKLLEECKYLNSELLHKDITDLIIKNLGLTFNDFIEKIKVRVSLFSIKDKKYNEQRVKAILDEIVYLILKMVKQEFMDYDKKNIIYQFFYDTLQLNGIKSKHLNAQMNINDFINQYNFY